jgi:hypothetical protein
MPAQLCDAMKEWRAGMAAPKTSETYPLGSLVNARDPFGNRVAGMVISRHQTVRGWHFGLRVVRHGPPEYLCGAPESAISPWTAVALRPPAYRDILAEEGLEPR